MGEKSTYNQKALEVYRKALPGYTVIGVDGYSFDNYLCFQNTDALHCRTHKIPDKNMVFIDSREVYNSKVALQNKYTIRTNIVAYSGASINKESVKINISINNSDYTSIKMSELEDDNYTYVFENLKSGDDVKYYIEASDTNNNYNVDPTCGSLDPHHFIIQ